MSESVRKSIVFFALIAIFVPHGFAAGREAVPNVSEKKEAVATIEAINQNLTQLSDQVWEFAETALVETKSAALLADFAEKQGFKVQRGVAQMPTAFVAEYGQGSPVIAILGEYDALPGLSQQASPEKKELQPGKAGHGCGHNLFSPASLGAAIAIKKLLEDEKLKGTIRFYGTPAEEAVGGKLYMIREGLFKDVDVALAWHPSAEINADTESSQAVADFIVEFQGKTSHAAFDPWNGRSALDGLQLFTNAVEMFREHVRPSVRIHYVITEGGKVPNVIPESAKLWCWVRDSKRERVEQLMERFRDMTKGAALSAGVKAELTVKGITSEMLNNMQGAKLLYSNLQWLGPIQYTDQEVQLSRELQKNAGVPPKGMKGVIQPLNLNPGEPDGGSTDVADVSWVVPTIHLSVSTAPEVPWHSWAVVSASKTSYAHKGMLYAAKAMATTMVDLFKDSQLRQLVRKEFEEQTKGVNYKPMIPDGPPPVPEQTTAP